MFLLQLPMLDWKIEIRRSHNINYLSINWSFMILENLGYRKMITFLTNATTYNTIFYIISTIVQHNLYVTYLFMQVRSDNISKTLFKIMNEWSNTTKYFV